MTLGRRQIALVLVALYVGAVWARLESLERYEYPFFDGESGTNYRYARTIAAEGSLPATDMGALRPDGFFPSCSSCHRPPVSSCRWSIMPWGRGARFGSFPGRPGS